MHVYTKRVDSLAATSFGVNLHLFSIMWDYMMVLTHTYLSSCSTELVCMYV